MAAEHGFGTADLDEIDFDAGGLQPPLAEFDSRALDPAEKIASLRRTGCQQALFFRDHRDQLVERYAGSYIFLQDGEVIWSGAAPEKAGAVQNLSGPKPDQAVWLKLVDPDEKEGEHMEVYERNLAV